jgi:hypothetical protein
MGVGGVSLYQQDQNYWAQAQAQSQASSAQSSLVNVIGAAMVDQSKGKASIANGIALTRVKSQLTAAVQNALAQVNGSSSSSSSSGSSESSGSTTSSSAASSSSTVPLPATGTGTVPLTTSTPLSSLGILQGGQITISAGANLTSYISTGTDTVGDFLNAINVDLPTNAQVTASLNDKGQLVITSRNSKDTFVVGGTYAENIGFGATNSTFTPTKPASSATKAASTSSTTASTATTSKTATSSSSSSSEKTSSSKTKSTQKVSTTAQQGFTTAAGILSADGVSGSLVDMLA